LKRGKFVSAPRDSAFLVVFDGLDLSGKSTLAAAVAEDSTRVIESPPSSFRELQRSFRTPLSAEAQLALYLTANLTVDQSLGGERVFLVRYYWSTLSYYSARSQVPIDDVVRQTSIFTDGCLVPAAFVLVEASSSARRRRLRHQPPTASDRESVRPDFELRLTAAFDYLFRTSRVPVLRVDTTDTSVEESAQRVRMWLSEMVHQTG
jgi:thymidylate kinase